MYHFLLFSISQETPVLTERFFVLIINAHIKICVRLPKLHILV